MPPHSSSESFAPKNCSGSKTRETGKRRRSQSLPRSYRNYYDSDNRQVYHNGNGGGGGAASGSQRQSRGRYSTSSSNDESGGSSSRHYQRRYRRSERSTSYTQSSDPRRGTRDHPLASRCIGVFGLNTITSQHKIRELFCKFGPIERIQMVIDAHTGRSRGFCFIYFESINDARAAKNACSGIEIDERRIRVDYSITQRAHTPTPGVYMGRPSKYARRNNRESNHRNEGSSRRSTSPYYRSERDRERVRRRKSRSRTRSRSPRRTNRY